MSRKLKWNKIQSSFIVLFLEIILLEIKKVRVVNMMYNKAALNFVPLRFIRQEWSVAPSIFNIKARGLAHCLY